MKKYKILAVLTSMVLTTSVFMGTTAYAADDDIAWKLHTATAELPTDGNTQFLLGDYNKDGKQDLYMVRKGTTQSGKTELHILNGADNFQSFLAHTATGKLQTDSRNTFALGDYNGDGTLDLYTIDKNGTGTHKTEVHVLNGADNFQSYLTHVATAQNETYSTFDFQLGDYNKDGKLDLFCIEKSETGSNKTELHVLNGADNFQTYLAHTATAQNETGSNYEFLLGDYNTDGKLDLYCLEKNGTGTGTTEVHILNGADNFQTYLRHSATPLEQTYDNFQFLLGPGRLQVYCVKKYNTDSGKTEVHLMGMNEAPVLTLGEQVVEYAKTFLGTPYVWGGTTPDGFDCSGYTQYVFNHFGIYLPRTTSQQVYSGIAVSRSQLQPGDLVFPTSGHVQIYIGNGQVIHSPETGDVVKISPLSSTIYAARRVIN